jgi:hypothetical protein
MGIRKKIETINDALATVERERHVFEAIQALKAALFHIKAAGAPRTEQRIRLAISSAEGAYRNAQCRTVRAITTDLGREA